MSSSSFRSPLKIVGLLALPLLSGAVVGCAADDEDEHAAFPGMSGIPGDPTQQVAASEPPSMRAPSGQSGVIPTESTVDPGAETAETQIGTSTDEYADTDPSALTDFRSTLDPHGQWVEDPTYGTMWQPSPTEVGSDFAPYVSGGHWGYDDSNDYVWMSDYGWGWAPFHYGRWAYGGTGWGWIPGREYAPSWATWRTGYPGFGYVGWAPLPPTWYWGRGGVAVGLGFVPPAPYAFCGVHDVFAPGLSGRIVTAPGSIQSIAGQTHPYAAPAGGRIPAHPQIAGPTPQSMHLGNNEVAHVPSTNPQLSHAQQFAHPSTAMAMGSHGPGGTSGGLAGHAGGSSLAHGGNYPGGAVAGHAQISRPSMPAYGGSAHSYYNSASSSRLGASYYGRGGGAANAYASPSYHHGGGGYHPPPSGGGPHYSGGGGGHSYGGGGGGHGGGGHGGGHR